MDAGTATIEGSLQLRHRSSQSYRVVSLRPFDADCCRVGGQAWAADDPGCKANPEVFHFSIQLFNINEQHILKVSCDYHAIQSKATHFY